MQGRRVIPKRMRQQRPRNKAVRALDATLAEMKLSANQAELRHLDKLAGIEIKLAVADTLAPRGRSWRR
jgi:hypothetical protein